MGEDILPIFTHKEIYITTIEKYRNTKFVEIFVVDQPEYIKEKIKEKYTFENPNSNNILYYGFAVLHWGNPK